LGRRKRSPGDRIIILPAILADPITQGLGLSRTTVFDLSSGALLLSAGLGPAVGRTIDNRGAAACLRYPIYSARGACAGWYSAL
jgi:hypothetical protein